jgi:hypothetical protein
MSVFDDRRNREDKYSKDLLAIVFYFVTSIVCIGIILWLS